MLSEKYVVRTLLWSRQHKNEFKPGDVIQWDMQGENPPDLAVLLEAGAIELYIEQPEQIDESMPTEGEG